MLVLVTYDVCTEDKAGRRRLRKVAKACESYGQRVQKSVFECQVGKVDLHDLRNALLKRIDEGQDSLRIYFIREPVEENREEHGQGQAIDFDEPLII